MQNQNDFDHIKSGKTMRHFVYPPSKLPDTEGFEDALREMCPEKIKELLDRASVLKQEAIENTKVIKEKTKKDSVNEFFLKTFAAHEFSEYFVIRKWLRYWTEMWRKVSDKPLPNKILSKINQFGYFEIQQARNIPLGSLYEGQLRKVGANMMGLCPFHEEKTPSFYVFPDNHFHCYGCGAHGDTIEFIQKAKGLEFPQAMKYLL